MSSTIFYDQFSLVYKKGKNDTWPISSKWKSDGSIFGRDHRGLVTLNNQSHFPLVFSFVSVS